MACPKDKSPENLNGVWTMNKTESDPTDPILALQGIGWIIRKAIGVMTVTLIIRETKDADGTVHIKVTQPGTAGIKGTEENRHIPASGEKEWADHEDHVFGHVKGYTTWQKLSEFDDADEDDKFLKQGWTETDPLINSYVESQGNGWTARQIWGFATVTSGGEEVRKHVRRVVVKKGSKVQRAILVYDFKEELRE